MFVTRLSNLLTRTRKTINGTDLATYRSQVKISQGAAGDYRVSFPHDQKHDPQRKFKEIARYLLISKLINGGTVLDFGSGSFYGAKLMAEKAANVHGIEANRTAVRTAKLTWASTKNLHCLQGQDLSVISGRFNYATIINVIEHMPGEVARNLLIKIGAHLEPNGQLFLSTPRDRQKITGQTENPDHVKEYSEDELAHLVIACGYKIETRYIQNMNEIKPGGAKDVKPEERAWFFWILKKTA